MPGLKRELESAWAEYAALFGEFQDFQQTFACDANPSFERFAELQRIWAHACAALVAYWEVFDRDQRARFGNPEISLEN